MEVGFTSRRALGLGACACGTAAGSVGRYHRNQVAAYPHADLDEGYRLRGARQNDAEVADCAEVGDGMNVDRDLIAVSRDLHEGEIRPRCRFSDVLAPLFHRMRESGPRSPWVVRHAAEDEAFEGVRTLLGVPKARNARSVGGREGVLDHRVTKLRAVDNGAVHEAKQVRYCVWAALALAATIHHELAICADRCREGFERRLELAHARGAERVLTRGRQGPKKARELGSKSEVLGDVADDQTKVPDDLSVEPGAHAACRWLYLGRLLKMRLITEVSEKVLDAWRGLWERGVQQEGRLLVLQQERRRLVLRLRGIPLSEARSRTCGGAGQLGLR